MAKWSRSPFVAIFTAILLPATMAQQNYDYSLDPIPDPFLPGDSYPNRLETDVCRPIFDHILRNSARFINELVLNTNRHIRFDTEDARLMTSRMQTRLGKLRELYRGGFRVLKAWTEFPDNEVSDNSSLHYEGRTIRVSVEDHLRISEFLVNAVEAAFDWVTYENDDYIRLSVIPDNCENNVDMVFILDQSGSVGLHNHGLAIQFILNVIQFFSISLDTTRVGFVAYSRRAHLEFDLDDFNSANSLTERIMRINYRGGSTATALGLNYTAFIQNPDNNRGARPASNGIPKVAILITDGKSNRFPLTYAVPYLKSIGVQVYALGIANPDVAELQFIASDPDSNHVFLLNSYNDAAGFVDFLRIQTCDTPAIIVPGDNTTTDVPEDGIRYFQVECDSFSDTVLVELYDNTGTSFLYCSATEQNPGPLTSDTIVNDTVDISLRTCIVSLTDTNSRVVYIGVQGHDDINQFTLVVWDLLFNPDRREIIVLEGETGAVYDVSADLTSAATGISFNFFILEGDTDGVFRINEDGRVFVPPLGLDFNQNPSYSLLIVAENVEDSCQRSRFRLNVRVGSNAIIFPALPPVSILETAVIGEEVTTVIAKGGGGQIEYSIISRNDVPFVIEPETGMITVNTVLNFEDVMQYSIIIKAESIGTIVSGTATVVVNIADVNEQPEWVVECAREDQLCMVDVQENQTSTGIGERLEVMDDDLPSLPNGQIDYRIVSTEAYLPFSVSSNGQVNATEPLDREIREIYTFTVIAADGGTPSLSVSTTFYVTVVDINDEYPVFTQGPPQIIIPENKPIDTVIAQYITTDQDTPANAEVIYTLSSPNSDLDVLPFELDPDNGALSIREEIDYEDLASRQFDIVITANNLPLESSTKTQIDITDVNDNEPVFDQETYTPSIPEHSEIDTPVVVVSATDRDSGPNGEIRYAITAGNSQGYFAINRKSGNITVSADIDREQVGSFELTVRAKDRGSPRLFSFTTVSITISDINDNPPIFNPDMYSSSLREDRPVNSLVFTVFATDDDKPGTGNSRIVYSIQEGNTGNAFDIDSDSGAVTVVNPLNHEDVPSYTLIIQAEDRGNPKLFDTARAEVTVVNVNEAPPTLSGYQTVNVSESTPVDAVIASFDASDADFMTVALNILGGNNEGRFQINNGGEISLVSMLDFETTENYTLEIEASDGALSVVSFLVVNVLDENEFSPVFIGPDSFSIDEELEAGTFVGTVLATDNDGSAPNNEITYAFSMQTSIQDYFILDGTSGEITTASVLDREILTDIFQTPSSSLSIQVFARDGGSPSLQNNTMYTIMLRDINDNEPVFGNEEYSTHILENQPSQVVLSFLAMDADLGSNANISYSFAVDPPDGALLFELVGNQILTTQGLDCEAQASYNFTITATDHGIPPRSSNVIGTVIVRDENDNAPVFTEDPYTFVVAENTFIDTIIGQVIANDIDKGSNGEVFYEIPGQDDIEDESESAGGGITFFDIDSATGDIRHITPFDFESYPEVNITIRATDRGTPRRSSTGQVIFTVTNFDESSPRFSRSCNDVSVSENTPLNSLIIDCMATDLDNTTTPDDAKWITYSIVLGNIGNTFTIGDHSGLVSNAIDFDYETEDSFSLIIRARDGSGRSSTRLVDIEIEDKNDNAPNFEELSYSFAMTSEVIESNTQMIATVRASDDDPGHNGDVHYSIEENGIERLSLTETRITITARDRGDTPRTSSATLTVHFDEECLLQKYTVTATSGVISAHVLCSVEIRTENEDVVLGDDHIAYCHVVRNSPTLYQWLQNGSAIDLTAFLPDEDQEATLRVRNVGFQDGGAYACKITTEAGSLQTSTYTVKILVVPVITVISPYAAVMEGDNVEFTCFAVGTPTPEIHWEYQGRRVDTGNTLSLEKADKSGQGDYSCVAVSSAGSSSEVTMLAVFVKDNVAEIVITNFDQMSPDGTCYYLNPATIENLLSSFGVSTLITSVSGENLCEISSCSPNPCHNGGRCELDVSVQGGYSCTCPNGYTGADCMDDIDECLDDPCGSSGECTNIPGLFQCVCSDSTGNRCQYTTTCTDTTCSSGELCIDTLSGYNCVVPNADVLVVTGVNVDLGFLDDLIVNYRETLLQQQQVNDRRKRAVTNRTLITFADSACAPRVISLEPDGSTYGLFWDCRVGEVGPGLDIQPVLCGVLVQSGFVESCKAANTPISTRPTLPPSLPKISVKIEVIQVDSSGEPLSIRETVDNIQAAAEQLAMSNALSGAAVDSVSPVNPIVCTPSCVNGDCTDRNNCTCDEGWFGATCEEKEEEPGQQESAGKASPTGVIVGAVIAVVVCCLLLIAAIIIIYITITKNREHKKRQEKKTKYARELERMAESATKPSSFVQVTDNPAHYTSTEVLRSQYNQSSEGIVEDNDYDQLPALKPSTVQVDVDNDHDELPTAVKRSPTQGQK